MLGHFAIAEGPLGSDAAQSFDQGIELGGAYVVTGGQLTFTNPQLGLSGAYVVSGGQLTARHSVFRLRSGGCVVHGGQLLIAANVTAELAGGYVVRGGRLFAIKFRRRGS